jgi:hypothetical protein
VAVAYEIVVRGELGSTMAHAFEGMRLECRDGDTAIVGVVVDQAQLTGLLNRIGDFGLALVSLAPIKTTDGAPSQARGVTRPASRPRQ